MSRGIICISESAPTLKRRIPRLKNTPFLNGYTFSLLPEQMSRGLTESCLRGVFVYRGPRNRIQRGEKRRRMETKHGKFPRIGVFQNYRKSRESNRRRLDSRWNKQRCSSVLVSANGPCRPRSQLKAPQHVLLAFIEYRPWTTISCPRSGTKDLPQGGMRLYRWETGVWGLWSTGEPMLSCFS